MQYFSEREEAIIKIIGRKKVTLETISSELFMRSTHRPFDSDISVANSVRRIIKKCLYHDLPWTLEKTRVDRKLTIKKIGLKRG